jgi:F-type H+-transporting ATPase subunit b
MLIDWFTVAAQVINFLILVWLLKRFLYRPVLSAIDAREKKIAAQLTDAAHREAQARGEREEFQRRNEALERDRESLMRKAAEEATAERQRLLEAARQDAQLLRSKLNEALAHDRQELTRRLSSQTQAEVFALTRKTLDELAGIGVEDRMVEVFLAHLRRLPPDQQERLAVNTSAAQPTAIVRSAFELSLTRRAAIKTAIGECLGADIPVRFELSPELVCGIDVTLGGVKLAWSVKDYLAAVSEQLTSLVTPSAAAQSPPSSSREVQHG